VLSRIRAAVSPPTATRAGSCQNAGVAGETFTRREVLASGLGGAAAAVLAACGGTTARQAASVRAAGSDLGAVEHVVILIQENRSFDHYFGAYRGVRGFDDHPATGPGVFAQTWPAAAGGAAHAGSLLPFHLDTVSANAECTFDLSHEWDAQHACWNGGRMDGFVSTHTSNSFEGPDNGVLTMGYYTRQDLDFYYALADAFTLCDSYHCSVMGPTHPNRLFALSGTLGPDGRRGGPVLITNGSSAAQFSVSWATMPERLSAKGVSWKTYNGKGPAYRPNSGVEMAVSNNILLYFSQYRDPSSDLYRRAFNPVYPDDFVRDVAHGTLPAVSWVMPSVGIDEHPPAPPALGMALTHEVLATLVSNPKVWSKTVLFITYDENDGFFDHANPPTPPPRTTGEYLTVDPLPTDAHGIAGPIGLGFRVPMLVVSPFSRGGYVSSDTFDHTSQLRFLETRFDVAAPNISPWRRATTGDLTSTLHVGSPDRSVPSLPATPGRRDARVSRECRATDLAELNVANPPPYPVPANQQMPSQEPGTARRVQDRSP
jgi:phospholipase C